MITRGEEQKKLKMMKTTGSLKIFSENGEEK